MRSGSCVHVEIHEERRTRYLSVSGVKYLGTGRRTIPIRDLYLSRVLMENGAGDLW
jgi:hypothetical protein